MERRNFLKTLWILPTIGLMPSLLTANEVVSTESVTGLNRFVNIIKSDRDLKRRVGGGVVLEVAQLAQRMNEILIDSIFQTGIANKTGRIDLMGIKELNEYIYRNHGEEWAELHGQKANGDKTGFQRIINTGSRRRLFGRNLYNHLMNGIYHLGCRRNAWNRVCDEEGRKTISYIQAANYLNRLLAADLDAGKLANPDVEEVVGDTGTGLDHIITVIYADPGLKRRISTGDLRIGAQSANTMNEMIVEAIEETNAAEDGKLTAFNIKQINAYIVENYQEEWAEAHGDDSKRGQPREETGFHKVQSDGAKTNLYGSNALNKVFDGIYHLGFPLNGSKIRLRNEDGNKNAHFTTVAGWLNELLAEDLANGTI